MLLTDVCNPKQWKTLSMSDLMDEGYPVYGANGIIGYYNKYTHEKETLMITCRGATCGTLNVSTPYSYINGNAMALDNLNEEIVNLKYIFYYLKKRGFDDCITGSAQPQITAQGLRKIDILVPPIDIQIKIARVLDKAQELIDKRKEQIEKLDEFIQSVFLDMFGDPVKNPKGWNQKSFANGIQSIKYGASIPPVFSQEGIPFIRATNIKNGRIIENDMKYISPEEAQKIEKCKLEVGDILIVRSGVNAGDSTFVNKKYNNSYGGYDIIVKLNNNLNYAYINGLFNSIYREVFIDPLTRRAGQQHLNVKQIQGLLIMYPPVDLQNKFSNIVEKTEQQKELLQNSLTQLENNFNSLMQRTFKGELFS